MSEWELRQLREAVEKSNRLKAREIGLLETQTDIMVERKEKEEREEYFKRYFSSDNFQKPRKLLNLPTNESEYPYCPSCRKHIEKPYYNGCPRCETPVVYSDGKQYPFTKEMIAEREKSRKRDEKYANASKLGKILLWLGELTPYDA